MFKFNNTHIFTGYLKQLLSSFNLPLCRVYTREFAEYFNRHGKEDPRIIESFDNIYSKDASANKKRTAARVAYLKDNELYNYFWDYSQDKPRLNHDKCFWKRTSPIFYSSDRHIPGLTRTLNSPGGIYDTLTHEYLGDYLRFMRDYYNINLMSLYNCFNNKICNNIYYKHKIKTANPMFDESAEESQSNPKYKDSYRVFDARDSKYRIYAFPVKLFSDYTIAIDCSQEIEMFCGFYKTALDTSNRSKDLIARTYQKVNRTFFKQPFLYDKLNVKYWNFERDSDMTGDSGAYPLLVDGESVTRWDIANREQDLKLFIKIPASCRSSVTVLEGDFRSFNDFRYAPPGKYAPDGRPLSASAIAQVDTLADTEAELAAETGTSNYQTKNAWEFEQNHVAVNFGDAYDIKQGLDTNKGLFKPISKLQLLAFNTGESYPFADRLVEYLSNSTITPKDEIADNIKRAQEVMSQNHHYFKIEGLWEDKMQKIIYDYMLNSGPIEVKDGKLVDRHSGQNPKNYGYHNRLGHTSKSTLYDVLGYVDKEAEKWYASWTKENNKAKIRDNIQNVDIYDGLYNL